MVKLKITRIINNDDGDEGEELYLTGEIVLSDGKYQMNQILNGEAKITACASDQVLEIPKLKIPRILDHEKHVITITWLESLEKSILIKAWFQFVFSDDNCVDELKEIKKYSDLFILMQNEFLNLKSQNKLKNIGLEELKEKKSCCCLYEQDMQLYRGVIQEVDFFTQTAKVMYIDFGNVDTVSFNQNNGSCPECDSVINDHIYPNLATSDNSTGIKAIYLMKKIFDFNKKNFM
ncbi:hypothetical protein BpHYR1_003537 [Brachionus plicatilis]|uniref:Tudor domain-containing protein n=1 Tax=Brachionus plicatilis TaxID=10195 RepID=A0A3M7P3S8_BRAPC|nr:hypothetical protein BpHYR1_003537 [Brachionus plicatilis]